MSDLQPRTYPGLDVCVRVPALGGRFWPGVVTSTVSGDMIDGYVVRGVAFVDEQADNYNGPCVQFVATLVPANEAGNYAANVGIAYPNPEIVK